MGRRTQVRAWGIVNRHQARRIYLLGAPCNSQAETFHLRMPVGQKRSPRGPRGLFRPHLVTWSYPGHPDTQTFK